MPEATIRQPGSVLVANLRRGDKLNYLKDTSPGTEYEMFEKNFFASIASSVGWAEEVVRKRFSNNYSASRATLILIWREANIQREEMTSDFCDPSYEMWLAEDIAAGRTMAPGWSDPYLRQAWLCCEWSGAPMPNIDPKETAAADQLYIGLGAQTPDDVARNLNGSSGKANRMKNARQLAELTPVPWSKAAPAVEPEPESEEL
jgi:capsid protein